jgi:hypothetical protein
MNTHGRDQIGQSLRKAIEREREGTERGSVYMRFRAASAAATGEELWFMPNCAAVGICDFYI